jgi:hypothetical protein
MAPQASKKCGLLPPDHHTNRFLHEGAQGTGSAVGGGGCPAPSQMQEKK